MNAINQLNLRQRYNLIVFIALGVAGLLLTLNTVNAVLKSEV
jgi:hypothetical protein